MWYPDQTGLGDADDLDDDRLETWYSNQFDFLPAELKAYEEVGLSAMERMDDVEEHVKKADSEASEKEPEDLADETRTGVSKIILKSIFFLRRRYLRVRLVETLEPSVFLCARGAGHC